MKKRTFVAEMVFSKILIKSLNLAENPYKIPKFGGKTNYIQKIGGDIISRNSTFFMYVSQQALIYGCVESLGDISMNHICKFSYTAHFLAMKKYAKQCANLRQKIKRKKMGSSPWYVGVSSSRLEL